MADLNTKVKILNNPQYYPYDPMGRGMDYDKAILWEAMSTLLPFKQEGTLNPIYSKDFIKQGLYPVRPEFIDRNYKGSGTYIEEGLGKDKILLNTYRPLLEMLSQIIPHELRHKQSGGLGGIVDVGSEKFEKRLRELEKEDYRIPQERLAYSGDQSLLQKRSYYFPNELRRHLKSYE